MPQPAGENSHAKVGRSMPASGIALESEPFSGQPLTQGASTTQTHSTDLSSHLAARFVPASQYEGYVPELARLPECMRQDVAETAEYLVPAGHGLTTAVAFFANKSSEASDSTGVRREGLVVLLHGLGQDCCESNWIWIHSFLKSGMSVLAVSMDGHSRTPLSSFDPRLATRTIPLIISKLDGLPPSFRIFAVGQGLGATYCLLAASRWDCAKKLSAVACISPRLSAEGASEMSSGPIPVGRPVQLCKDGVRLGRYYGTGGFRRLWRGDSGKLLRKRLLVSAAVETQVEMFLSENVASQDNWTKAKVPVAIVASDRSPTFLALERVQGVNSMLVTRFDKDRTIRGLQFTEEWPRRVTRFFESYRDDVAKGLREEF